MSLRGRGRLVAFLLLAGCASRSGPPLQLISSADARDEWDALRNAERTFSGVRALLDLRLTQNESAHSFRAVFRADASRRVLIDAITPIGTTAFTLFIDGDQVVWIDHLHSSFWKGSVSAIPGGPPILKLGSSRAVADVILGLPVQGEGTIADEGVLLHVNGATTETVVTPTGIAGMTISGASSGPVVVEYAPPRSPPASIRISGGGSGPSLEIMIREIDRDGVVIKPPRPGEDYLEAPPAF